jgi:hypothetical protein
MMKSLLKEIRNFDQEMVGEIVLKFTYIRLNADKKTIHVFLNLIISIASII